MKYIPIINFLSRPVEIAKECYYSLTEVKAATAKFEKFFTEKHVEEMQAFAEWINAKDIHMTNSGYWKKNNPSMKDYEVRSTKDLYDEWYAETHKPDPNQLKAKI